MKFAVAAAALIAGVSASYNATAYTTEVVDVYVTYCPAATEVTVGTKTYTVTEATTLTVTDCSCTITRPVYSTSSVACTTCTTAPVYPTTYPNTTVATTVKGTGSYTTSTPSATVVTAGAGKAISGAALAGVAGIAAFFL